jgi:hypothetical protein
VSYGKNGNGGPNEFNNYELEEEDNEQKDILNAKYPR